MLRIGNWKLEIGNSPLRGAGFTLIEIILVIALIGALGTWMISLIDPVAQFKKGRDAERKAELAQLQAAFELYRADKGEYPMSTLLECGQPLEDGNVFYIQKIPCDPDGVDYSYDRPTSSSYTLVACLENVHDSKIDESNNAACQGGDRRSYTVTNP